jgi:fumarate hydratase class I
VWLEQLEVNPSQYLPDVSQQHLSDNVVKININRPMKEILNTLTKYPIKTRLSLTGTLVVARGT